MPDGADSNVHRSNSSCVPSRCPAAFRTCGHLTSAPTVWSWRVVPQRVVVLLLRTCVMGPTAIHTLRCTNAMVLFPLVLFPRMCLFSALRARVGDRSLLPSRPTRGTIVPPRPTHCWGGRTQIPAFVGNPCQYDTRGNANYIYRTRAVVPTHTRKMRRNSS